MQFIFVLSPVRLMLKTLTDSQRQRTELQQAAIARKRAQDELLSILNKTPGGIYRLDKVGKITFVSEAVRRYGYRPQRMIGRSIMSFVHPDDRPGAQHRILERRSGKRSANEIEVRLSILNSESDPTSELTAEKKWVPFHVSSEGLYSDDAPSPGSFGGTQGTAAIFPASGTSSNRWTDLSRSSNRLPRMS